MEVRYKLVDSPIVITPLLAVSLPTRDYPTLGHAAQGRGLKEYSAGFDFGYNAIAISPYLFVSGRYLFTYVERIDPHVTVDRSNADFHVMYLATSRLTSRASTMWQNTHGGLDLPLAGDEAVEHFHHHDQLARANHWRAGVGLSFALTPSLEMLGAWSTVLESENSHAFRSWTAGVAWNFDGARFRRVLPTTD